MHFSQTVSSDLEDRVDTGLAIGIRLNVVSRFVAVDIGVVAAAADDVDGVAAELDD